MPLYPADRYPVIIVIESEMQTGENEMSDKNQYYGLGNLANVMEIVMQNNVDTLIEAEQEPTKPSLFKRLMNAVHHNASPLAGDTAPQTPENTVVSPYPAR